MKIVRRFLLAAAVATLLSGCATDPNQFGDSVNNAVENTHVAAVASVTIGTDIIRAIIALVPAVLDVVSLWHN